MLFHSRVVDNLKFARPASSHGNLARESLRPRCLPDGNLHLTCCGPQRRCRSLQFPRQKEHYPKRMKARAANTGEAKRCLWPRRDLGAPRSSLRPRFSKLHAARVPWAWYVGTRSFAGSERAVEAQSAVESCSPPAGGARMRKGYSQPHADPPTTVGFRCCAEAGCYIVVLTHPTTGGVTAS